MFSEVLVIVVDVGVVGVVVFVVVIVALLLLLLLFLMLLLMLLLVYFLLVLLLFLKGWWLRSGSIVKFCPKPMPNSSATEFSLRYRSRTR